MLLFPLPIDPSRGPAKLLHGEKLRHGIAPAVPPQLWLFWIGKLMLSPVAWGTPFSDPYHAFICCFNWPILFWYILISMITVLCVAFASVARRTPRTNPHDVQQIPHPALASTVDELSRIVFVFYTLIISYQSLPANHSKEAESQSWSKHMKRYWKLLFHQNTQFIIPKPANWTVISRWNNRSKNGNLQRSKVQSPEFRDFLGAGEPESGQHVTLTGTKLRFLWISSRYRHVICHRIEGSFDSWKSRGGQSQRGGENKWEDQRRERVRRKKLQVKR